MKIERVIKIRSGSVASDTAGELAPPPGDGLGDYVERQLRAVGVTKERFTAAKAALGLPPTCGCAARKAWLNRAGEWAKRQLGGDA